MVLTQQGEWHQVMTVTALNDSIQHALWKGQNMYTHKNKSPGCITPYAGMMQQKLIQIEA